ncbi:molybdopterin-binding protein [Haloarcula salina]|uniref:molybdopterin-binding protein n=1 Tax=Haloarcula salina TaxID=1429914 RepID=UPI003C6F7924
MVDFQSRDTRRGPTDDEDERDDGDGPSETDADAEAAASPDQPTESETSTDGADGEHAATGTVDDAAQADDAGTDQDPLADDAAREDSVDAGDGEPATNTEASTDRTATGPGPATSKGATGPATAQGSDSGQSVAVAVVTVGTATEEGGDPTSEHLETTLEADGHTVTARERLRGDYDGIQQAVDTLVGRADVDVVVTAGGIGVGPSEATLEAVHPLFEKALPGFEEVYRSLLFEPMGTSVITVRATAGIADGTPVFCLPEDPDAAGLAVDEIIAPEAGDIVAELQ